MTTGKLSYSKPFSVIALFYTFVKKYPRVINYSKFLLIAACFLCIAATYTEIASVKQTMQPPFIHQYCSYNFRHNYTGCLSYMNRLSWRYYYDALRFMSVPIVVFIIWFAKGTKQKK